MSDHAVVIGIETYPGIKNLQGPCNDVDSFIQWLEDPNGGGLEKKNIAKKTCKEFPPPLGVDDAHPVLADLQNVFRPLVIKAARQEHTDGRLFIYVAGHGFAEQQDMESAALITADADQYNNTHMAVLDYANYFRRAWAFKEIIVLMDTCRTTNSMQSISPAHLLKLNPHVNAPKVKMFIGLATGHGSIARERDINGRVQGIFTTALIDALKKASPNRKGIVNGSAIKNFIHTNINEFSGSEDVSPPEITVDESKEVTFLRRDDFLIDIKIIVADDNIDKTLVIKFGGLKEVYREVIKAPQINVPLKVGLYKVEIIDTHINKILEVIKDEQFTL
ncbi:MAG: caspase family protein [Colwellia sp.]|nr:caspase family protein [Colwellia sp.]